MMRARKGRDAPLAALERAAMTVAARAHAPWSGFRVGAALLFEDGSVEVGCNVESASFGATLCAERAALAAMVAAGKARPRLVLVYTPAEPPASPCGVCRQVLAELAPDAAVVLSNGRVRRRTTTRRLLPDAFRLAPLDPDTGSALSPASRARTRKPPRR